MGMGMTNPYTPDEAMDYRTQLDTAMEELTEHDPETPAAASEAPASAAPVAAGGDEGGTATVSEGWLSRLTRRIRRS
jgi:hypothetical protein